MLAGTLGAFSRSKIVSGYAAVTGLAGFYIGGKEGASIRGLDLAKFAAL